MVGMKIAGQCEEGTTDQGSVDTDQKDSDKPSVRFELRTLIFWISLRLPGPEMHVDFRIPK
jgi:hypothetical protein